MILTDITSSMTWIVNMFITGFTNVFNWLSSFEFAGTNMLKVICTITILGAFLPVLLTIPQNMGARAEKIISKEERAKRRNDKNSK